MKMKKLMALVLALTLVLALAACGQTSTPAEGGNTAAPAEGEQTLIVYTARSESLNNAVIENFEADTGIHVEVVTGGTGEVLKRVRSEAANPQGDICWAADEAMLKDYTDCFEEYVSPEDANMMEGYKNTTGYSSPAFCDPTVFIVNTDLAGDIEINGFADLLNPALKGKIAYCSPSKSGSAYTQLCTMLFSQPTIEEGWDLVERFIANLDGKVQDSSGNCHKLVASGEYALGVTIEKSAVLYADNPDIGYVYPEKNSAVPDGVALIKDCPNEENAKLFIDFVTSYDCQVDQNTNWARRPVRNDLTPEGLCELSELDLGDYDFAYAANNKEAIVEQWNDLTVG